MYIVLLSLSLSLSYWSSEHGALASSAGTGHADVDQDGSVYAVCGRGAKGVRVGGEAHVLAAGGKVKGQPGAEGIKDLGLGAQSALGARAVHAEVLLAELLVTGHAELKGGLVGGVYLDKVDLVRWEAKVVVVVSDLVGALLSIGHGEAAGCDVFA